MRKLFLIMVTCLLSLALCAQPEQDAAPVHFSDTTWCDKGFDFYIGGGMFIGNKFNANYYNGSNLNENNLNYIFFNQYWKDELDQVISEYYPGIQMGSAYLELDPGSDIYNWESHYKLTMMVSLGMRYKIRNGWGLSLSYSFSRLTSSSQCLLSSNQPLGNEMRLPVMAMVGKEDRSTIDFMASYLFSKVHKNVKPFLELGVQFNYAKAKSFKAVLLDKDGKPVGTEYSLLNQYDSEHGYTPGAQTYDITYGGPGFGFSGAAGLKIAINKTVSLDPTFYCYMGRLGIYQMKNSPLPEFREGNKFTFNYGVLVRVVMSDFFFSKR
ncbi:MAG: hypothetical protein IK013_03860 [Bacteroidales bacterium]|nr:hypothetical protein [Bacteroidales bacterium]